MAIFDGIDATNDDATIVAAASVLVRAVEHLAEPRSLCECGLDAMDYRWLRDWGMALKSPTVARWLDWVRASMPCGSDGALHRYEAIGSLLLCVAAETARREAHEGQLWPTVRDCFTHSTQEELFVQGHPTVWHKEAMEEAVRRLRLRNVIGIAGTQHYYDSVYLQFGFTRHALPRLPFWLAGSPVSAAVQALLGKERGSASFRQLWSSFRDFRKNNVGERHVRDLLRASPWVLPDWHDELIRRCRERPELGTASDAHGTGPEPAEHPDAPITLMEAPRLRWNPPAEPCFSSRLINLAALALDNERYDVYIGNDMVGSLFRQPDGSYRYPDPVTWAAASPEQLVRLVDEHDACVHTETVVCWLADDDVTLFDMTSGWRIDAWRERPDPRRAYALLTAADLHVAPEAPTWVRVGSNSSRLSLLAAGTLGDVRITLEEKPYWSSAAVHGGEAPWSHEVQVFVDPRLPAALGQPLRAIVSPLPREVEMLYVRSEAGPWDVTRDADRACAYLVGPPITPDGLAHGCSFVLGLRRGRQQARIRRAVRANLTTATRLTEWGWQELRPGTLTVESAAREVFRIVLAREIEDDRAQRPALFEGAVYAAPAPRGARPLGAFSGYGGALRLRRNPFNEDRDQELLTLADAVVCRGVVQDVRPVRRGRWRIHLRQPIEPAAGNYLLLWPRGRRPERWPISRVQAAGPNVWELRDAPTDPEDYALAIVYERIRLGAWWPGDLRAWWRTPDPAVMRPVHTAALIRWFHLPVLEQSAIGAFRSFACHHPAEALAAWLSRTGLPDALRYSAGEEEWLNVVRSLFWDWQPEAGQASSFLSGFGGRDPTRWSPLLAALAHLSPLLVMDIVQAWSREACPPPALQAALCRQLVLDVAGLPAGASRADVARRERELLDEAARVLAVDARFLERGIVARVLERYRQNPARVYRPQQGTLDAIDTANVQTALGFAPFRSYLGLRLLVPNAAPAGAPAPSRR